MIKKKLLTPFQKFVKTESLAGILLFGATIIALIWANSGYANVYEAIWQTKLSVSFQGFQLNKELILWINDGLMAIFFFLIGLELKRELLIGEINTLKKAAFPLVAALGGVIFPVGFYILLNQNPETARGWGVPMATDIAFALAILSTLGKRVPLSLKIFLTAFAIIDDIAAVLVIAIAYSVNINWSFIVYGLLLIGLLAVIYKYVKYNLIIGLMIAAVVWVLFLKSGIHPTIAGVLLAFSIPIKRKIDVKDFAENMASIANDMVVNAADNGENHLLTKDEIQGIDNFTDLVDEVTSPLQNLENKLHSLVAYFILPLFAFANAGVAISTSYAFNFELMLNIAASLVLGKLIGVTLLSYLGVKLKLTELPKGVSFKQIIGIAAIAGVGFTMAIFIDNLAFSGDLLSINSVKVGIILGSLISGITGYTVLRFSSK
jgi:NhaA family Na+:H+ antiporter